ncbi:MAG: glycosyltransferase [Bacteroidetes bacterium]|nr:glycosyltransferase [Bacteroidota bacterium]
MKILFSTYLPVTMLSGGPKVQISQTSIELKKLGVDVKYFDQWKTTNLKEFDLVHLFAANIGTYHFARILKQQNIPFVVSPIIFSQRNNFTIKLSNIFTNTIKNIKPGFYSDFQIAEDICNWSKHILPNTSDELLLVQKGLNIPSDKITLIPNGVESKFLNGNKNLFKKKYKIENFLLNVGHIGPERKNIYRLLKAIENTNHKLVIIGRISKDSSGEKCTNLAKNNRNVLLIDSINHDSQLLQSAYSSCSAFVLPSLFETPGIAALEAALSGAPIVITEKGGTRDYFQNFAHYVNPLSTKNILGGINSALSGKQNDELKNHIKNNFLWSHVAKKTMDVYKYIISNK